MRPAIIPENGPRELRAGGEGSSKHLRTDHLLKDLKGRAVRGGAVTASGQVAKLVLQMGSTMVLARLLVPADFGLIQMVSVCIGFVAMFKDAGLSMATVQRQEISQAQVSTLFWINLGLSISVMLVTAALAPVLAWFYNEPRLVKITLALAASFLFGGLTVQHQALLRRQMRFKALAVIEVLTLIVSILTAITMAWFGCGYWSLVGMSIASSIANCILVWIFSGWRPGLPVRGCGVRSLLKFGGYLTGFNTINYLSRNLDNFLVGWWWGPVALGFYSKAYSLLIQPVRQVNAPLSSVMAPTLSRLHGTDSDRFRRTSLKLFRIMALVSSPVAALVAVFSEDAVRIILGSQWTEAVPIVRWLSVICIIQMIFNQSGNVFTAQNRADLLFKSGVLNSTAACLSFLAGLRWGPVGVAAAYTLSGIFVRTPILMYYLAKTGCFRQRDLYAAVAPIVCITLGIMALGIWALPSATLQLGEYLGRLSVLAGILAIYAVMYVRWPAYRAALAEAIALRHDLRRRRAGISLS